MATWIFCHIETLNIMIWARLGVTWQVHSFVLGGMKVYTIGFIKGNMYMYKHVQTVHTQAAISYGQNSFFLRRAEAQQHQGRFRYCLEINCLRFIIIDK